MKAILEKISYQQEHSFRIFQGANPRFNCPFHYHPEIELTSIVSSTGHRYVGDHIGRFAPGDLVLMGPNLPHSYINDAKFFGRGALAGAPIFTRMLGRRFFPAR